MNRLVVLGIIVIVLIAVVFGSDALSLVLGTGGAHTANVPALNDADPDAEGYEIVSLLPKDAIPAIYNPQFVSGAEADEQYGADELVLGVEINGDARAYSIPYLSGHEIVNDVVGGEPVAVTW